MSTTNITISVQEPVADALRDAAAAAGQSLSAFVSRAAMNAALREAVARHAAWAKANPDEAARMEKEAMLAELEREAAQLAEELAR